MTVQQPAKPGQPVPVWLAALVAAQCLASDGSGRHAIPWDCGSGKAMYTNDGTAAERIEPLGVSLEGGQTLTVYWEPGETGYTVEVYGKSQMAA